jgi:tellurite resistance protein TerC
MILAWIALIVTIIGLVLFDLLVANRAMRDSKPHNALAWAIFYLGAAAAFNFVLFFAYRENWLGLGLGMSRDSSTMVLKDAHEASLQFITALLVELSLDLDSVFVFAAIFTYFKTPMRYQRRVLMWGVLVALAVRGAMIAGVGALLHSFDVVRFVFSGLLVLAALRMILIRQERLDPDQNPILWLLKRVLPISPGLRGSNLVARVDGKMALTPLLVTLVMIETADAIFAIDSVPAVYAVTRDPFLVFAATAFSLLVLRSLYFVLASYTAWLRYLKVGLAGILAFMAVTMALPMAKRLPTEATLAVVCGLLGAGLVLALVFAKREQATATTSPLGEDAERIARLTLKQARRLIVLVVGFTIILIGIVMLVGPGPGALVVPIGLALLASEFIWARRLLNRYTEQAQRYGRRAGGAVMKYSRVWMIPIAIIGFGAALITVITLFDLSPWLVVPSSLPFFVGMLIWAYQTVRMSRRQAAAKGALETLDHAVLEQATREREGERGAGEPEQPRDAS